MSGRNQKKSMTLLGQEILPGKGYQLNLSVAKLHTSTSVQVPVIVERAKEDGPTVVLMAGVHGDEINGVEIIRTVIRKKINKPLKGTIICIPILNIFGFLNLKRELPDGRDLNRSFPGSANGSLASQFAFHFMKEITPLADIILDFHTGAANRNNYPQIRCVFKDAASVELAKVFNPPFILDSPYISKTIRESVHKRGKMMLLFEGGKSNSIEENVVEEGVNGVKRVLNHYGLRAFKFDEPDGQNTHLLIESKWMRASMSGLFRPTVKNGARVEKGEVIGFLTDPYGKLEKKVKSIMEGFVFCVNEAPIVYKGDAIFHIGRD